MKNVTALYKIVFEDHSTRERILAMTDEKKILEEIVKLSNKHNLPVTPEDIRPFLCEKKDMDSRTNIRFWPA